MCTAFQLFRYGLHNAELELVDGAFVGEEKAEEAIVEGALGEVFVGRSTIFLLEAEHVGTGTDEED